MLKKTGMIVLVASLSILLSSCHIKQKEVVTIARTTDTLHIYQSGEWIEYNVSAVDPSSGTTTQGVLRVDWTATAPLQDPINNSIQHDVLKETTILTYNDDPTTAVATVIRYITQVNTTPPSVDQGSIILQAIDDGTGLYWLYDKNNITNSISPVEARVIFDSPMAVGVTPPNSLQEFSVMANCANGTCGNELYRFADSYTVDGDTTEITTNLGKFSNPFKLSFTGLSTPGVAGLALSVLGDIRQACGNSDDNLTHNGEMFVMPEIGIIQMINLCQVTGGIGNDMSYSITLRNTNITLP